MLQLIRDHVQGVFVWTIIALIIAAFAMVGVNSYLSGDGKAYVAKVNDTQIPLSEYQVAYQQERAFRQQIFGDNISPALLKEDVLQRATLSRIISAALVTQASEDAGFRVANAQLASRIRQMQEFQSDGQFDQNLYTRLLNSQGMTQESFEDALRRDMQGRQLMDGVVDTALLTANETDRLLRLRKQQRRFSYMVLEADDQADDISIDDAAIQQYYDEHAGEFVSEEQVSIEYLELRLDSVDPQFVIEEQQLQQMYEEQLAEFSNGEERRASHILIKADDESEAARQTAAARAQDLYQQLQEGADFAELARAHSDDPGSARQGGDLGFFGRGMMVGAFEDKVFTMNKGETSEPVQSPYGYHIIKLTGIQAGDIQSFAEVRDELEQRYRMEKAEEQFFELVDQITNLTFESPDTLAVAADELGLTIKTSELFYRHQGTGIAAEERVRTVAFSDDVLEAGNNSDVLTLDENHMLVLRIKERRPSAQRSLNEVRADIVQRLRKDMLGEQLQQRGKEIIDKLRKGEEASALARANGSEWISSGFIDRFDTDVDDEVLKQVFRMSHPAENTPTTAGARLSDGSYVVASLYAVRDGSPAEVDDEQRQVVIAEQQRSLGQHLGAKVLDSLRARAKVVEYTDNL